MSYKSDAGFGGIQALSLVHTMGVCMYFCTCVIVVKWGIMDEHTVGRAEDADYSHQNPQESWAPVAVLQTNGSL